MLNKIKQFNDFIGSKLSFSMNTMWCFYLITLLVVIPLFFQTPSSLVGWIQYVVSVFFQGVALPVLGYTSAKSGSVQEKLLKETHDNVINELKYIQQQQISEMEEKIKLQQIISEIHEHCMKQ